MGNAGSAIRWNSVPYAETTQAFREPTWAYYSQVSISSPYAEVEGHLYAEVASSKGAGALALEERPARRPVFALNEGERRPEAKQTGPWTLTQRELEVLQLLAEGATNSEISLRLYISQKTTKNHLAAIFQKLDVTNRTQALVRAVVMGLVSIE